MPTSNKLGTTKRIITEKVLLAFSDIQTILNQQWYGMLNVLCDQNKEFILPIDVIRSKRARFAHIAVWHGESPTF